LSPRLPLGRAHQLASIAMREVARAGVPVDSLSPVGSLRRFSPDVGDVSLLAAASRAQHREVLDALAGLPYVTGVARRTPASITLDTDRGPVTVHLTTPEQKGAALVWHTGSRQHVDQLRARARRLGFVFDDGQLAHEGHSPTDATTEEAVYGHLQLAFIAPELREDTGEIAAAERGELPVLVGAIDIRGDLHMHSTWSDGRDSVETMVDASRRLGYEYVAITDHSQRAFCSRKLAADDIARQRDEIEALRHRVRGISVLHGVEVDIMKDGSLDFDDEQLVGFDVVLASLHDHGGQDGRQLTARCLQAIQHPLVTVITHPANRSPAGSRGYDMDFDTLFAAAAETGTAMEIDGAPGHLDMDGALARRAIAARVTIAIDSDCHRSDALGRQMRFGVGTARRGWVEAHQVLNARSLADVRTFITAKRERL
jgi:DNA polymerase (family X)